MERPADDATAYVDRLRSAGKSDVEIAERLQQAGWSDAQIGALSDSLSAPLALSSASRLAVPPPPPPRPSSIEADPETKSIVAHGFLATDQLVSPNGAFGVCCEMDFKGSRVAYSVIITKRMGLSKKVPLSSGTPLECAVSDLGYVIVTADTQTKSLTGDVFIIGPSGRLIMQERVGACTNRCGLSEDGQLAWCTTLCNPDRKRDSSKLMVFRTTPPSLLFRVDEPVGTIDIMTTVAECVCVVTEDGRKYRYSLDGSLLNGEDVAREEAEASLSIAAAAGDGYYLVDNAEALLSQKPLTDMTAEERETVRDTLSRASECNISDNTKARVQRRLGEIALVVGDKVGAMTHLRNAVELNPKVGVKRQLEALERGLPD